MTGLIKIHCQLSHVMQIAVWYVICAGDLVASSQVSFCSCQIFFMSDKNLQENVLPFFVCEKAEEAKIWRDQQVQHQTRSLAPYLSDRGSHCLKTKNNGWRNSRTLVPPMKLKVKIKYNVWRTDAIPIVKHRCRCRRGRPQDFLFLVSWGMVSKNVWRTNKSKLKQHNTNAT